MEKFTNLNDPQAYTNGWFAGWNTERVAKNPYPPDGDSYKFWEYGWKDAQGRCRELGLKTVTIVSK